MPIFLPEQLSQWTGGKWNTGEVPAVNGFAFDTRQLVPGAMFIALTGEVRDGHDFVEEAKRQGAVAALVSKKVAVDIPQLVVEDTLTAFQQMAARHRDTLVGKVTVIGVTGSCGKTSTKDLAGLILGKDRTFTTAGNLNNFIGLPLSVLQIDPAIHCYAVIEAGTNSPGEIDVLAAILRPDAAIITVIGDGHLEKLINREGVAQEKAGLARHMLPEGCLYMHADTYHYEAFRNLECLKSVAIKDFSDGAKETAPVVVNWTETELKGDGRRLTIRRPSSTSTEGYELPFEGEGMIGNSVLVIALARDLGISPEKIQQRLPGWTNGKLRGEICESDKAWFYVDCYNANPTSMRDSVLTFGRKADERLKRLYVLGCMKELGPETSALHRRLGASLIFRPEDQIVIIGTEASAFAEGMISAGTSPQQITLYTNTEEALKIVHEFEGAVFLKGSRGYALERLLPDTALVLNERLAGC